ncbi:Hypothetical_protein [Hexamita inflata]|uniref:Hypothetical_protein n=1 Tax=Hexamita inflata TaxID=28002 RepID=A0AA86NAA4_9EUKA|nr:Hypothetical protein HINF_LOCUS3373 [Hexamita inflata]CAI9955705.1 Hypothetical protein HINF_LOCUS43350 [Hexamita inflata]
MQLISNPVIQLSNIIKHHEQTKIVNKFVSLSALFTIADAPIIPTLKSSSVYEIEEQDSEFKFNLLENISCSDISSEIECSDISDCSCVFKCFSNSNLSMILLQ